MNAHINHDLPLALVSTCVTAGVVPDRDSPQHHDFLKVNDVLAAVEAQVKTEYLTGLLGSPTKCSGASTMCWRCGASARRETPHGPTLRCFGRCAIVAISPPPSKTPSMAR